MTEEEVAEAAAAGGDETAPPTKKKTSVKVVRRVKSKKSEKGERPELAPPPPLPPATIEESPAPSGEVVSQPPSDESAPAKSAGGGARTRPSLGGADDRKAPPAPPSQAPVERRVSSKRRTQRSGSNVFSMFTQNQVAQFKEAFGFIDQDKDGIISKSDIRACFDALGRLCSEKELEEMTSEAPGPINFTMFLSVFGDRIQGVDDEEAVLQAFNRYDEGDGFCHEDKFCHALMTWGEKFTKQECEVILREAPVDSRGRIDIKRFATLVTRGADEEEEAD